MIKKSKKLKDIKVRPIFVKTKKKTISYKLSLLKDDKVYPIFYLLL